MSYLMVGMLLLLAQKTLAQSSFAVHWLPDTLADHTTIPSQYPDTTTMREALAAQVEGWQSAGYLEASVDAIEKYDSVWMVSAHRGGRYQWQALLVEQVPDVFLAQAQFPGCRSVRNGKCLEGEPVSMAAITAFRQKLVAAAAAAGYPFARCDLEWSLVAEGQIAGNLRWASGGYYVFDTLAVRGDIRIATEYLAYRLQVLPGDPFDRTLLLAAPDRVEEIPFLTMEGDPTLRFQDGRAQVGVDVALRRASRFDFLLGVLPNSPQTNRLLITGDLEAELYNSFGAGERLYASYERLRPETQELQLALSYPYVFRLPFGVDGAFSLYRRDTTFLNVGGNLGVTYFLGGRDQVDVFFENQASNLLSVDTIAIIASGQLPAQLDTRRTSFGLGVQLNRLDYQFNPRQGWQLTLRATAGIRRILRNNDIAASEANHLYDALEERTPQYEFTIHGRYFFPLFVRSTLLAGIQAGSRFNATGILRNEQFRLGGNRQLRGFDEEFFFASQYTIATLEYRLLIGRNAYLFAFLDGGWLENTRQEVARKVQYPVGMGTGLTFETAAGLFGLSVAVGGTSTVPIDFAAPKVHFGYVSLF